MKVLFVGLASSQDSVGVAARRKHLESVLREAQVLASVDERAVDELGGLLYLKDTAFSDPASIRRFDAIDLVLVSGDARGPLPWSPDLVQVSMLLAQCVRFNKPVIGVEMGALFMAFAAAVGTHRFTLANETVAGGDAQQPRLLQEASARMRQRKRTESIRSDDQAAWSAAMAKSTVVRTGYRMDGKTPASVLARGSALGETAADSVKLPETLFLDDRSGDLLSFSAHHGAWHPVASCGLRRWDKYANYDTSEKARVGSTAQRVMDSSARPPPAAGGEDSLRVVQAGIVPRAVADVLVKGAPQRFSVVCASRWRLEERRFEARTGAFQPLVAHMPAGDKARGVLLFRLGLSLATLADIHTPSNMPLRQACVAHVAELARLAGRRGRLGLSAAPLAHTLPQGGMSDLPALEDAPQTVKAAQGGSHPSDLPFQTLRAVAASVKRAAAASAEEASRFQSAQVAGRASGSAGAGLWVPPPSPMAERTKQRYPEHAAGLTGADSSRGLRSLYLADPADDDGKASRPAASAAGDLALPSGETRLAPSGATVRDESGNVTRDASGASMTAVGRTNLSSSGTARSGFAFSDPFDGSRAAVSAAAARPLSASFLRAERLAAHEQDSATLPASARRAPVTTMPRPGSPTDFEALSAALGTPKRGTDASRARRASTSYSIGGRSTASSSSSAAARPASAAARSLRVASARRGFQAPDVGRRPVSGRAPTMEEQQALANRAAAMAQTPELRGRRAHVTLVLGVEGEDSGRDGLTLAERFPPTEAEEAAEAQRRAVGDATAAGGQVRPTANARKSEGRRFVAMTSPREALRRDAAVAKARRRRQQRDAAKPDRLTVDTRTFATGQTRNTDRRGTGSAWQSQGDVRPLGTSMSAVRTTLQAFQRANGSGDSVSGGIPRHPSLQGIPGPLVNRADAAPAASELDAFGAGTRRAGATSHVYDSTAALDMRAADMEQLAVHPGAATAAALRPTSPSGGLRFWDNVQATIDDKGGALEQAFLDAVRRGRVEAEALDTTIAGTTRGAGGRAERTRTTHGKAPPAAGRLAEAENATRSLRHSQPRTIAELDGGGVAFGVAQQSTLSALSDPALSPPRAFMDASVVSSPSAGAGAGAVGRAGGRFALTSSLGSGGARATSPHGGARTTAPDSMGTIRGHGARGRLGPVRVRDTAGMGENGRMLVKERQEARASALQRRQQRLAAHSAAGRDAALEQAAPLSARRGGRAADAGASESKMELVVARSKFGDTPVTTGMKRALRGLRADDDARVLWAGGAPSQTAEEAAASLLAASDPQLARSVSATRSSGAGASRRHASSARPKSALPPMQRIKKTHVVKGGMSGTFWQTDRASAEGIAPSRRGRRDGALASGEGRSWGATMAPSPALRTRSGVLAGPLAVSATLRSTMPRQSRPGSTRRGDHRVATPERAGTGREAVTLGSGAAVGAGGGSSSALGYRFVGALSQRSMKDASAARLDQEIAAKEAAAALKVEAAETKQRRSTGAAAAKQAVAAKQAADAAAAVRASRPVPNAAALDLALPAAVSDPGRLAVERKVAVMSPRLSPARVPSGDRPYVQLAVAARERLEAWEAPVLPADEAALVDAGTTAGTVGTRMLSAATKLPFSLTAVEGGYEDEMTLRRREEALARARFVGPKDFVTSVEGADKQKLRRLKAAAGGIVDDHSPFIDPNPAKGFR